jgi:hypothetical protein
MVEQKKGNLKKMMIQKKITDSLKKLPEKEVEQFLKVEEKKRKLELKESKENIWGKMEA